jgi:parallel beta-helix repeat protein
MKKFSLLFLALAMLFAIVGCCNETTPPPAEDTFDGTDVADAQSFRAAVANGGQIRLTQDIALEDYIEIAEGVEIFGNGKTLTIACAQPDFGASGLFITSSDDVTIQNLTIKASSSYGAQMALIYLNGSSGNVTLENLVLDCNPNNVYSSPAFGIQTTYDVTSEIQIEGCSISNAKYGMYFNSISNSNVINNTITNTKYNGIVVAADNENYPCNNVVVGDNVLANVASENYPVVQYNCGIYIGKYVDNVSYWGNYVQLSPDSEDGVGIYVEQ